MTSRKQSRRTFEIDVKIFWSRNLMKKPGSDLASQNFSKFEKIWTVLITKNLFFISFFIYNSAVIKIV